MSDRKRLLTDLRVVDLRAELEKRNLDKSGIRSVLIQRLSKYLEEDGHDPATYEFDLIGTEGKVTPSKRTRRVETVEADETPAIDDMIVQDDTGEEETEQETTSPSEEPTNNDLQMEIDETEKVNRKREIKDETEAPQEKKPCLDEDIKAENNADADDSINLHIGDDELLNEETDNTAKTKTDEAADEEERAPAAETSCTESAAEDPAAASDAAPGDDEQQITAETSVNSNDNENAEKEQKDDKDKDGDSEKTLRKDEAKEGARNLWVSGLSGDTRAKDLKQLCSKYGKVIGAKVVTNARTPGSRCYGYVTMASSQDAENCIKNLHRTELHGRMISVEKAKSESESSRRQPSRSERRPSQSKEEGAETKEGDDGTEKSGETKKEGDAAEEGATRSSRSRERSNRSENRSEKDRRRSTKSRERKRSPREVLSFSKIWKERDVARARERSRLAREEERRRRAAEEALRERERRQRQEKRRLEIEREKLRAEREKIEREKNELLRLERERHKLEREKLELERLELKRAQLRLEEERRRRGYESSATYRKPSPPPEPAYERDQRHKRPPPPSISSSRQYEAPPPPRFEVGSSYERGTDKRDRERDYKREYPRHVSSSDVKYPSNGTTNDDSRQPMPPGTRPKEPGRTYEARDSRPYRPSPTGKPEPRSWNASSRYPDAAVTSKGSGGGEAYDSRYGSSAGGSYDSRYEARTMPAYQQPPPPGAPYPDRYAPPARDYRKY